MEELFYGNDDQQHQHQGGAAGTPPTLDSERDQLLRHLNRTADIPVVDYPEHGQPINDFSNP